MQRSANGFSLIEILVVLVIIAFTTNLIVYSIGNSYEDELEQEAFILQTSINYASEFAILNQRQLGLYVEDNSYEFLAYSEQKWQPLQDVEGVLKGKTFAQPYLLRLEQEDLPWSQDNLLSQVDWQMLLGDDDDDFLEREKMKIPQVMILSSGEITPFELFLEIDEDDLAPFIITGEFMAPVSLNKQED